MRHIGNGLRQNGTWQTCMQKAAFRIVKDGLLHGKKRPSANCLTIKRLAEGKKNGENFYSKLPPFLSTLTMKLFLL